MALINNNYVLVETESVSYATDSTSHPVEKGIDITDHVRRQPITLSVSGKIVDTKKKKSKDIIADIQKLQKAGSLIKYVGRISLGNLQIQSFSCDYSNKTWGGCDVEISLKEVRIAKSAYDATKSKSNQKVSKGDGNKVYHTVKKGDCVWNLVVSGPYKNLKPTYSQPMQKCNWVMSQNPNAFSRKGDFTTLQIGKKLYVGNR